MNQPMPAGCRPSCCPAAASAHRGADGAPRGCDAHEPGEVSCGMDHCTVEWGAFGSCGQHSASQLQSAGPVLPPPSSQLRRSRAPSLVLLHAFLHTTHRPAGPSWSRRCGRRSRSGRAWTDGCWSRSGRSRRGWTRWRRRCRWVQAWHQEAAGVAVLGALCCNTRRHGCRPLTSRQRVRVRGFGLGAGDAARGCGTLHETCVSLQGSRCGQAAGAIGACLPPPGHVHNCCPRPTCPIICQGYHSMADRLALIPATAKRAEGVNFEVGLPLCLLYGCGRVGAAAACNASAAACNASATACNA